MAYTKTLWQKGDVLTAEKLNRIESGIESVHGVADTIQPGTSTDAGSDTNIASTAYVRAAINKLDYTIDFSNMEKADLLASTWTKLVVENGIVKQTVRSGIQIQESQVTNLPADLALKAPINSPTFTGTVTLPGNPEGTNEAANKGYVDAQIASLDSNLPSGSSASKTLTALNMVDGKMTSATFTDISINKSQVSGLTDSLSKVNITAATNAASEIQLAPSTKYLLSVGDGSMVFTTPVIPTNVSQLTNDSGFLTAHQDISKKLDIPSVEGLEPGDYTLTMHIPSAEEETTEITYKWVANPEPAQE